MVNLSLGQLAGHEEWAAFVQAFDMVTIADGAGIILAAMANVEEVFGVPPERLIGERAAVLEADGVVRPSSTALVLRTRSEQAVLIETAAHRRLAVSAIPVFGVSGQLSRVLNLSRDVTDTERAKEGLSRARCLVAQYSHELLRSGADTCATYPVFSSRSMMDVMVQAQNAAAVDCPVLITGESGTGKDLVAKLIHAMGPRKSGPYLTLNCAAIPEGLLESELFGYAAGAFTGARAGGKKGLVELATGGTLVLGEIGDMPVSLQAKLLHLIEGQEFLPVGGERARRLDARLIATTNKNLRQMTQAGLFREDLFWRLNVIVIQIPPLRERREDIAPLARHFLGVFNRRYGRDKELAPGFEETLMCHSWPGNVRELEHLLERLVIMVHDKCLDVKHVACELGMDRRLTEDMSRVSRNRSLRDTLESIECHLVAQAVERHGSTREAARALGISQASVVRKLRRWEQRFLVER